MSVLSSYAALLGWAAPPLAGKFSGGAAQQLAATVSLPRVPVVVGGGWRLSSRAPLFVCGSESGSGSIDNPPGAPNQKNTYDIHPNALKSHGSATQGSNWKITEDNDNIWLELELGEAIDKEKLEVAKTEDQVLLIKCKVDSPAASKLDVRLLMPQGYGGTKVDAEIIKIDDNKVNKLKITIKKPKPHTKSITIT